MCIFVLNYAHRSLSLYVVSWQYTTQEWSLCFDFLFSQEGRYWLLTEINIAWAREYIKYRKGHPKFLQPRDARFVLQNLGEIH
jgi:hypothetical protein